MRLAEINECAWRLSAHAMMEDGGKWVVCSTGKLREIYGKTSSDGFKEGIKGIIDSYDPPDNKKANAVSFSEFGGLLTKTIEGMDQDDVMSLMRYVLWDVAVLERLLKDVRTENEFRGMLKVRMEAEDANMEIIDEIIAYLSTVENGGKKRDDRKKRGKGGYRHGQ